MKIIFLTILLNTSIDYNDLNLLTKYLGRNKVLIDYLTKYTY